MSTGRRCYDCDNYRESLFCGYVSSSCAIHGSLDVDQNALHPDTAAKTCKDYTPKRLKSKEDRLQRMIRALWPNGYIERRKP